MKFLAFGHVSRAGKDTAAKMAVSILRLSKCCKDIQKREFAAPLKAAAYTMFKQYGLKTKDFYDLPENEHLRNVKLPLVNKTPVEIWIDVGMKIRDIYSDTWVDAVLMQDPCDFIVISDLRFPNEAKRLKELGGICVKIERQGLTPQGSDHHLKDYTDWDVVISNNSSLSYLQGCVADILLTKFGIT